MRIPGLAREIQGELVSVWASRILRDPVSWSRYLPPHVMVQRYTYPGQLPDAILYACGVTTVRNNTNHVRTTIFSHIP
jgi:hypothetical protein